MAKDKEPKIDPELKRTLNKEGWEGDKEGGAAVFVGTKEEIEKAREIMEKEGRTENLESYLRLHKEIVLPYNEIDNETIKQIVEDNKGLRQLRFSGADNFELRYIDKDGNVAKVEIFTDKIDEMKSEGRINRGKMPNSSRPWKKINERLNEMGFPLLEDDEDGSGSYGDAGEIWHKINWATEKYKEKLEKETKETTERKRKKEFDF